MANRGSVIRVTRYLGFPDIPNPPHLSYFPSSSHYSPALPFPPYRSLLIVSATFFLNIGTLLRDPFIKPFKEERQKYYRDHHEPKTHQLNRFSIYYKLLRQDPELLNDKKSSIRSRKKIARENLLKISRLSSLIFTLYYFLIVITELGSKSYLEIIPKLQD